MKDFAKDRGKAIALWGLPVLAILAGGFLPPGPRALLWISSLSVMGTACLVNASRCGRVHCYFTGPFFLLGAAATAAIWMGLSPSGERAWNTLGGVLIVGGVGLRYLPELIWGAYVRKTQEDAAGSGAVSEDSGGS